MANTIEEILRNKYSKNKYKKNKVTVSIKEKDKRINYAQCMQNMCKTCRNRNICENERNDLR